MNKLIYCITEKHKKETKRALEHYLNYVDWKIDKTKSLAYFKQLQNKFSIAYYKKQMYQIMKFLKHNSVDWVNDIKLPSDPDYTPKRITITDIKNTLEYLSKNIHFKKYKALILLGFASGLRAEELYKLTPKDIDLDNRTVYVRHDPKHNHSTKNKKNRVSFFTSEVRDAISDFLEEFYNYHTCNTLFSQRTTERAFKNSPIRVKDLRKAFSQEWTRKHGDTGVKKILMGHSFKNDIDLMHYNFQSEEDLKMIYDKVMGDFYL